MADTNYGNGGLSNGPGAGPAALAFLALAQLQAKYQEIVQAKADLSTVAAKGAQALVIDQNQHYSNEVTDQAWQQWAQAIASGINAFVTACSLLGTGAKAFKEVSQERTGLVQSETQLSNFRTLQESIANPADGNEAQISRDLAPPENSRVTQVTDQVKSGNFSAAAEEKNPDVLKAVGAKLRQANTQDYEAIKQQIADRVAQASQAVSAKASLYQAAMMKMNFVTQVTQNVTQALSSAFTGLNKTCGVFAPNGDAEKDAHNAQQLDMLYSQMATAVMNDQMSQVTKAWDLETSVMTQIWKAIADSQRV